MDTFRLTVRMHQMCPLSCCFAILRCVITARGQQLDKQTGQTGLLPSGRRGAMCTTPFFCAVCVGRSRDAELKPHLHQRPSVASVLFVVQQSGSRVGKRKSYMRACCREEVTHTYIHALCITHKVARCYCCNPSSLAGCCCRAAGD